MLKVFNAMLVVGLVVSAFVLYSLEHSLRKHERHIASLKRQINTEKETIKPPRLMRGKGERVR